MATNGEECEIVKAAFHEWDTDGNGKISKAELSEALGDLGMKMDDSQLSKLLRRVSQSDGDGGIGYEAFVDWLFKGDSAQNPSSPDATRGKVREALGIEEDEDEDEDEDEGEDEEDYDYDYDYDYDEEDDDDDEEESEVPQAAENKTAPKKGARKPHKKNKKANELQGALDQANNEIAALKAKLDESARRDADRRAKKEAEKVAAQAEKERKDKERIASEATAQQQVNTTESGVGSSAVASMQVAESPSTQDAPVEAVESPKAKAKAKGKAKAKAKRKAQDFLEEGVVCTQEIQMSEKMQIRSALGLGNDVWTIDWGGMVSVRARHDCEEVKKTINTGRFVTSMLYIAPNLMWLGQEDNYGIRLIDTETKKELGSLTKGHSSLISSLVVDDQELGEENTDGTYAQRRVWSGSDDFTIRGWSIQTWRAEAEPPIDTKAYRSAADISIPGGLPSHDAVLVDMTGGFKVAIKKGLQLHGHKGKIKTMLRLGPCLWSGSDDGTIRIWNCADSLCKEIIQAHRDGVTRLSSVRSFVWSCGTDGTIREWSNHVPEGGNVRQCLRSVRPEGFEKGVYTLLPIGKEVWTCGHDPNIKVFGQQSLEIEGHFDAHNPYVSKIIPVDRMITKTVWTTSFADRKLKVWNHVCRDDTADTDVLKAENKLFIQSERTHASHVDELATKLNQSEALLSALGFDGMDPETAMKLATSIGKILDGLKDFTPEEQAKIFESLAGVVNGLSHLSAEDVATALEKVGDLLKNLGTLPAEQMHQALEKLGQLAASLSHLSPEKLVEALDQMAKLASHLADKNMLDVLEHLPGLIDAFNDAGLKRLLKNPDTLKKFLQAFVNQGMEHLIDDPEKMEAILKIFNDLNARGLLDDNALNAYMRKGGSSSGQNGSSGQGSGQNGSGDQVSGLEGSGDNSKTSALAGSIGSDEPELKRVIAAGKGLVDCLADFKDMLEALGIGDIVKDPSQLRKLFEAMQQIKSALEDNGFGDFFTNPKKLADFLANYNKVKKVFEDFGLLDVFEDPYDAKGFLSNYTKLQEVLREAGLEHLMAAPAMKDFLAKYKASGKELEGMGDLAAKCSELETALQKKEVELQKKDDALQKAKGEIDKLKATLAAYEKLGINSVDDIMRLKDEIIRLKGSSANSSAMNSRISALERELANKEQERLDALEREKVMFSRYKELDIFKLDIIARELKGVLKKVELTEKHSKQLKDDANRFKDYADRRQTECNGNTLIDDCKQTEAHIHDVILKCFNETQRKHIGVATDNEGRAKMRRDGRLLDGGTMIYSIDEEVEKAAFASVAHVVGKPAVIERPDYGSSKAAPAYRGDAIRSANQ